MIDTLASLSPVSLPDLQRDAALMTRSDRKYLLPVDRLAEILARLPEGSSVLEIDNRRGFRYESTYFDTEHATAYLMTAHRRPGRFKVRTRRYVDTGTTFLEAKVKSPRGLTVKTRLPIASDQTSTLSAASRSWLRQTPNVAPWIADLTPRTSTLYVRHTVLLPQALGRVTIDSNLTLVGRDDSSIDMHDWVIVETKTASSFSSVDRLLWSAGHRPASVSKFALAMALHDPTLPRNRWRRIIERLGSGPGA